MLSNLYHHATHRPTDIAFVDDEGAINYRDLALRAVYVANELGLNSPVVGIMAPNGINWVVAYLGAMLAGKTIVPLPPFFSDDQVSHIIENSKIDIVLGNAPDRVAKITKSTCVYEIPKLQADHLPTPNGTDWQLVIYTSGTTGTPKGVRLNSTQVSASVQGLAASITPCPDDRYLSVLPFSLLLEQITGILLPLHAGVCSHIATRASMAALGGDILPFANTVNEIKPSITVLVPDMLAGWLAVLSHLKINVPESLRFVAVGGAHVREALLQQARDSGIPAYEGYGLSECCSVVAVNTPDADRPGAVGRPLPGVSVSIDAGEIVVTGPNVMAGYLGGDNVNGRWATGDMGFVDDDGFLFIQGRADNILVTSRGRNVTPEWIENMMTPDPRISRAIVFGNGQPSLSTILIPTPDGRHWFDTAKPADVIQLIEKLCQTAPDYARPGTFVLAEEEFFRKNGLINRNGQINRHGIEAHFGAAGSA